MSVSINNSKDIVCNSLRLINNTTGQLEDVTTLINNSVSDVTGVPPETLSTIEAVAAAINNDPNYFVNTQAAINAKANQSTTYTKSEVDASLSLKVNQAPYDVQVVAFNTLINSKANAIDVYSKAEVDASLGLKANQSTTYTKTEVDTSLGLKADSSSVYTKAEVDLTISNIVDNAPEVLNTLNELAAALNDDANYATTIQNQLNTKADIATTYTKTEVDSALSVKMNTDDGYLKLAEGDDYILEIKPGIRIIGNSTTEEIRFNYYDLDNSIWRTLFYGKWDELNDKPILLCNNLEAISGDLITLNDNLIVTGDITVNSILGNALTQIQNLINSSISNQTYSQSQIDTSLGLKQNTLINGTIPANTGRVLVPGTSKIRSINGDSSINIVEVDDAYMTLSVNSSTVNKSFVGLGNVDNTSDVNKPISTATQAALDLKFDKSESGQYTYANFNNNSRISWDNTNNYHQFQYNHSTLGWLTYTTIGLDASVNGIVTSNILLADSMEIDTITSRAGDNLVTVNDNMTITGNLIAPSITATTNLYVGGTDILANFDNYIDKTVSGTITFANFDFESRLAYDNTNNKYQFQYYSGTWGALCEIYYTSSLDFGIITSKIQCDAITGVNTINTENILANTIQANGNAQVDVNDNLTVGGTLEVVIDSGASFKTTDNGDGIILATLATTRSIGLCSNGPAYTTGSAWIKLLSSNASPVLIRPNTNGVQLTDGATAWSSYSDPKLKNIKSIINNNVELLQNINPIRFSWKKDKNNKDWIGLNADEIMAVLPEVCDEVFDEEENDNIKTVRYTDLIPILIGAIHELQSQIDDMKKKL